MHRATSTDSEPSPPHFPGNRRPPIDRKLRARRQGPYSVIAVAQATFALALDDDGPRGWYNHVGVVAVTSGLVLWIGYDRPISAIAFSSDVIGGELSLLTILARSGVGV